jgi:hypothetical protein
MAEQDRAARARCAVVTRLGELRAESGRDRDHGLRRLEPHRRRSAPTFPPAAAPPRRPDELVMQVRQGRPYVDVEPLPSGVGLAGAHRRESSLRDGRRRSRASCRRSIPVTERPERARRDRRASTNGEYRKLAYLRKPLKYSFQLTLTLVPPSCPRSAAVWGACSSARPSSFAPIQDLVAGTRAVAKGDFDTRSCQSRRATTSLPRALLQ